MKFESKKQAKVFASLETQRTGVKHFVKKTQYFCLEEWNFVPCYTVVIK